MVTDSSHLRCKATPWQAAPLGMKKIGCSVTLLAEIEAVHSLFLAAVGLGCNDPYWHLPALPD